MEISFGQLITAIIASFLAGMLLTVLAIVPRLVAVEHDIKNLAKSFGDHVAAPVVMCSQHASLIEKLGRLEGGAEKVR